MKIKKQVIKQNHTNLIKILNALHSMNDFNEFHVKLDGVKYKGKLLG